MGVTPFARLFRGRSPYRSIGLEEGWGGRYMRILQFVPYAALAAAAILSQLQPYPRVQDRLIVIGLAIAAAIWTYTLYTARAPQWRQPVPLMLVYVAGFLVFAWLLEAHSFYFVAFTIVGFLQAFFIFPVGLAVLSTAATSIVMYLAPGGFQDPRAWPTLAFLVVLQTAAVTGGNLVGVRIQEEQEQRKKVVADLEAALQENVALHAQLVAQAREAGVLDERQRLAGEIHDTLAQGLAGIITQLEAAAGLEADAKERRAHLEKALALARQSLGEARRSVRALRPAELESSQLQEAIGKLASEWSVVSGVPVLIQTVGEPSPLAPEVEVTIFRLVQESLTNVGKHARAHRVVVTVSYLDDAVRLDVLDDGVGFAGPGNGDGYGLVSMRQRISRIGGTLDIETTPGGGTTVTASIPVPAGSDT